MISSGKTTAKVMLGATLATVALAVWPAPAVGQTGCGWEGVDPATGQCADLGPESGCWYGAGIASSPPGTYQHMARGFHLNLDQGVLFGPGDFPPRTLDPIAGSLPLVSNEALGYVNRARYRERPTHRGVVDLITGIPLLQEIDFELPFGGAVFRHVRTYSENATDHWDLAGSHFNREVDPPTIPHRTFADWNGLFWMMGEHPIFLMDAQFDLESRSEASEALTRRCYFIPDAHHAIPFISECQGNENDPDTCGQYVAPPWFDADLDHNGDMGPDAQWITQPTEFYVSLHNGSVKYTIQINYSDMWVLDNDVSAHTPPTAAMGPGPDGGYGLPYFGRVTKIEDRYGNRVEYEYCDFEHATCDAWHTPDCKECCPTCNQKDQIRRIRLYPAGETNPAWSLLYCHRGFGTFHTFDLFIAQPYLQAELDAIVTDLGNGIVNTTLRNVFAAEGYALSAEVTVEPLTHADEWLVTDGDREYALDTFEIEGSVPQAYKIQVCERWGYDASFDIEDRMVHSIHVYEGDADFSGGGGPVLTADRFCEADSLEQVDAIDCAVPSNWVIEARYTYSDGGFAVMGGTTCPISTLYEASTGGVEQPMKLLKATITRRSEAGAGTNEELRHSLYRYDCSNNVASNDSHALRAVYDSSTVDAILAANPEVTANGLLGQGDTASLIVVDPETGEPESTQFGDLADLEFTNWPVGSAPPPGMPVDLHLDQARAGSVSSGVWRLTDRREGGEGEGQFDYYRYVMLPGGFSPWGTDFGLWPCMLHYPYQYPTEMFDPPFASAPWDQAFFVTVVDEQQLVKLHADDPDIRARHVYHLNPAGFVIYEWHEVCEDDVCEYDETGLFESNHYDCKGRVHETRSRGWHASANKEGEGLIQFYEYEDPACPGDGDSCECDPEEVPETAGPLTAVGVKRGTEGTQYYLSQVEYGIEDRPELVTAEIRFSQPVTALPEPPYACPECQVTTNAYAFREGEPGETLADRPILARQVRRPAVPASNAPGAPEYHSVQQVYFDEQGRAIWQGTGAVPAAGDPQTFFVNYSHFDGYGNQDLQRVDFAGGGEDPTPPTPPDGLVDFVRVVPPSVAEENPPLNLTTTYDYDRTFGLEKVVNPNGREQHIIYIETEEDDGPGLIQWIYRDVVPPEEGEPPDCTLLSPVEKAHYAGGKLISKEQIKLDGTAYPPPGSEEYDPEDVISSSETQYDQNGRFAGLDANGSGGESLSARISYTANGEIGRHQDTDGTVTRYAYDGYGRLIRTYRGTSDEHWYWNNADACDWGGDPEHCEFPNDNLVLIEKRGYGEGATDAGELVTVRQFREKPNNQYLMLFEIEGQMVYPDGYEPDEDTLGLVTHYDYDWRMRPVWVEVRNGTGDVLHRTVTWYDHQDQVRFAAEFGPGTPASGPDPRAAAPGASPPTAAEILASDPAPLSLSENTYNARGLIEESRRYDISDSTGNTYTVTRTYYNHADQAAEVHSSNGPIQRYEYDAKGRQILSWTEAEVGGTRVQLSKTRTHYDDNDRSVGSFHYERRPDATGNTLDATNSVIAYSYTWYDLPGKVVASASFGTGNETYTTTAFSPPLAVDLVMGQESCGAAVCYDPRDPPESAATYSDALVTLYGYDEAGRQNKVVDPGGIETHTEFDGLGRVVLTIENATGAADERRYTAYRYHETTGQLEMVAAVRPDFFAGIPEPKFSDINWDALPTDGSMQVTRYEYGAPVIEADDGALTDGLPETMPTEVSLNNSFVHKIFYPDPETGQPEATESLEFQYRSDGQVVYRQDKRGVELVYGYDVRDRLASIGDYSSGAAPEVDRTARKLLYDYTDNGMLATAQVLGESDVELNTTSFAYDSSQRLTSTTQDLPDPAPNRTVTYTWDQSTAGNWSRLTGVTYPGDIGTVDLDYGPAGGMDDVLSRVSSILDPGGRPVVSYRRMGQGRIVGTILAALIGLHLDDGAGGAIAGLDGFGRTINRTYAVADTPVLGFEHGYDLRGNRLFSRINHHAPDQSWLYGYDGLNRLVRASRGELNPAGDAFVGGTTPETITWDLDILGNWSAGADVNSDGAPDSVLRFADVDADGVFDTGLDTGLRTDHHGTNQSNEIAQRQVNDGLGPAVTRDFFYDEAGNLILDPTGGPDGVGQYYVYDAWGRIVEVRDAGTLDVGTDGLTGIPGEAIARYDYDALGRRIRTTAWPGDPNSEKTTRHAFGSGPEVMAEYDVGTDGAETLERWFIHGESFPDPVALVDLTAAGDVEAGIDEYLYYLKDTLGSVAALANAAGEVVERYVYDPYGRVEVLSAMGTVSAASAPATYAHDFNLDGIIDADDDDHFLSCLDPDEWPTSTDSWCVYFHDVSGDGEVTLEDYGLLSAFRIANPDGAVPPPEWVRPGTVTGDGARDTDIDLVDLAGFQQCIGATPGSSPLAPWCLLVFDINTDNQITLDDWATTLAADAGPGVPVPTSSDSSRHGNPLLFTAQRYDAATRLYHFWARSYDPVLGRFLQRDKLGLLAQAGAIPSRCPGKPVRVDRFIAAPGDELGDGFSLYQYARSDPQNLIDTFGLKAKTTYLNHVYPCYLGGHANGPGIEMSKEAHTIFHKALHEQLEAGYGEGAREAWKRLRACDRKRYLTVAAQLAGVDVSDRAWEKILRDAYKQATHGVKQTRGVADVRKVKWIKRTFKYRKGMKVLSKLKGIGKAIPVVGGIATGLTIAGMAGDPNLGDIASITSKYRRSGEISMIDEVFIFVDLHAVAEDPIAAAYGWELWHDMNGL